MRSLPALACSLLLAATWLLPAAARAQEPREPPRVLRLRLAAGIGAGTVAFERPTRPGSQLLDGASFAASELALQVHAWPNDSFSLAVTLAYQTSLGLELRLGPQFAVPEDVAMRLQRGELSLAPVIALDDERTFALAFPIGAVVRSLVPEVHQYDLPNQDLGSALLRAELWLELASLVRVQLGPELQWLVAIDSTLRDEGVHGSGIAFGGQALVELLLGPTWRVAVVYRESRAYAPAGEWLYHDVERFVTVRVTGEL